MADLTFFSCKNCLTALIMIPVFMFIMLATRILMLVVHPHLPCFTAAGVLRG